MNYHDETGQEKDFRLRAVEDRILVLEVDFKKLEKNQDEIKSRINWIFTFLLLALLGIASELFILLTTMSKVNG